ncbi:spore coat protein [Paenibacillus sp.]|uniref:spore coat protein n=1 Tax=Paenibacillus sp. TaxID=58172 RepID=UPI002D68E03C|nr:spore coat protein [Paenibacillus sp.]HZG87165.1 spore coat protein [Paenibacillus sp.]
MKFGAHEVMEVSELLTEKMNLINHLAMYEQEAQDEQLRSTIRRHLDAAVQMYDLMVAYTHDYSARNGMQPPYPQPDANLERLRYGLRNPQPMAPQRTGRFNDMMIQTALLTMHKASAISHTQRGLEITDPNLRQMVLNGAITCYNQAYETFLLMNQQGTYQVPTIHDHTAKTMLHSYMPMNNQGLMMEEHMGAAGMQGLTPRTQGMPSNMPQQMNMNGQYMNQ